MENREAVAAIVAGDPAGIAVAYDRYAADLYGYCHWILGQPAEAAEALRDTFVIAATSGDESGAAKFRPWLYAVARHECRRRRSATSAVRGAGADAARGEPDRAVSGEAAAPDDPLFTGPAGAPDQRGSRLGQADVPTLVRGIVAHLTPREREVIELNLRHHLDDDDLAIALRVSRSRAHAQASRARGLLEKALSALIIARTGREACPALDALLADWDGQLTEQASDLIGGHIEQCETCAGYSWGVLRPVALSGLMPLAPLPSGLRAQVLTLCSGIPDAVAYRRRVARRAHSLWYGRLSQAVRLARWKSIRGHPGAAIATVAVMAWVVAAVSVTLFTFAGSRPAHAVPVRPNADTPAGSHAVVNTPAPIKASTSAPRTRTGI